jgi:hypothetical protein
MLSAGIVALSTGWAVAAPVQVLDYLNLRSGPGFYYSVIEIIPAGWFIDAGGCVGRWCQVNVNGIVGYADINFLSFGGPPVVGAVVPPPPVVAAAPPPVVAAEPPPPAVAAVPPPYYYPYPGYYDPYYAYSNGYAGAPYPGPYANAYAEAGGKSAATDRRLSKRAKRDATAKTGGTAVSHVASAANRGASSNGTGKAAVRPNRSDQNPAQ